jgi:transcriptional regulator with XRE-family HTH domain
MSIPLHEKIRLIREAECLSRSKFASLTGLSPRTLEAIENKGNSPRGDALEKIAIQWPRYAYWLLTGKTHSPMHIQPNVPEQCVIRVYERISNPRPEAAELMTKAEWLNKLTFLQCSDQMSDLYAFIETKQTTRSGISQCILIDGDINFCSDNSGKNRLTDFAAFLVQLNRADLIRTSEMKLVTRTDLTSLYENWEICEANLATPDLSKSKWLKNIHINFSAWRINGTSYTPKHSYQDMQ